MRLISVLIVCLLFSLQSFAQPVSETRQKAQEEKQKGDRFYSQNFLQKAIDAYRKATEIDPDYTEAWDTLGNAFYEQKNYASAIDAYQKGVDSNPSYTLGLYNIGYCYQQLQNHSSAIDAYQSYLNKEPNDPDTLFELGMIYRNTGQNENAEKTLRLYLQSEKRGVKKAQIEEVRALLQSMQTANNLRSTKTTSKNDMSVTTKTPPIPEEKDLSPTKNLEKEKQAREHKKTGDTLVKDQKLFTAAESYRKATILDPTYLEAWKALGDVFVEQKEFVRAIAVYRKTLILEPDYHLGYYNIAYCHRALGEFQKAEISYRTYLQLAPEDPDALFGLAVSLSGSEQTLEAIQTFETYIAKETRVENQAFLETAQSEIARLKSLPEKALTKQSPSRIVTHPLPDNSKEAISQGNLFFSEKQFAAASLSYAQAVTLSEGSIEAQYKLGISLALLRRYPEAVEHLSRALEGDPGNQEIRHRLDHVRKLSKQQSTKDLLLDPSFVNVDQAKIQAARYLREGRYLLAAKSLQAVLTQDSNDADIHKMHGDALLLLGNPQKAQEAYLYALALRPSDISIYKSLGDVHRLYHEADKARYYYELFLLQAKPSTETHQKEISSIQSYLAKTHKP